MPHLSPMNWMLAPLMFFVLTLSMIMTSIWWYQTPTFPILPSSLKHTPHISWNWS